MKIEQALKYLYQSQRILHWPMKSIQRKFQNSKKKERKHAKKANGSKYENFSTKWTNYMIKRFYCLRLFLHPTAK